MRKYSRATAVAMFLLPSPLFAGMPSYSLTDVARMRIQELSFFLLVLLLCSFGVKVIWNLFSRDFPKLPRLRYPQALALTALLGLVALLILSMISGARELLTPGAWRRQGSTHVLSETGAMTKRQQAIESLRHALWKFSAAHEGKFPEFDFSPEVPETAWRAGDEFGSRFIYERGLARQKSDETKAGTLLASEPENLPEPRFVLLASGEIELWPGDKISTARRSSQSKP